MVQFNNEKFDTMEINKDDLFICAVGYEQRSVFLYEKMKMRIAHKNILVFYFEDYKNNLDINKSICDVIGNSDLFCVCGKYEDELGVQNTIVNFVSNNLNVNNNIHIDYSSMPRKWYCRLPFLLKELCQEKSKLYFWYSTGSYEHDYECYPSAGIESYSIIGKTSLRIEPKRLHVFGLSYDAIRTKALISILDPDAYVTCNAYDKKRPDIEKNIRKINKEIIEQGDNELPFVIEDFSFMVAKLCELVNEYLPLGDVIFVPDGPKPLIFAMSLVPQLLQKEGVTCIHVSRNQNFYEVVNVEACGSVYGFSIV